MYKTIVVLVLFFAARWSDCGVLKQHTKELARGKVLGAGFSVFTTSSEQCQAVCNKRRDTCDGIVYHSVIGKCRLINKCAKTVLVENSTDFVYMSKRPQIHSEDYKHDQISDSCLKLLTDESDYATSDYQCFSLHGQLAVVNNFQTNAFVKNLIQASDVRWAWIGDLEKFGKFQSQDEQFHHIGNNLVSEEPFIPQVLKWRNDSLRSCWAINAQGQWGQFSCRKEKFPAVCQVITFDK